MIKKSCFKEKNTKSNFLGDSQEYPYFAKSSTNRYCCCMLILYLLLPLGVFLLESGGEEDNVQKIKGKGRVSQIVVVDDVVIAINCCYFPHDYYTDKLNVMLNARVGRFLRKYCVFSGLPIFLNVLPRV